MSLSINDLKSLSFGYLCGQDLIQFAAAPLLIKQYEVDPQSLQRGCDLAYSQIQGQLSTRYDIATELNKKGVINAIAKAVISAGVIASFEVIAPGLGYTSQPVIVVAGGGGIDGAGTAVLLNGSVTSITKTNGGSGYTSAPVVSFSGGIAPDTRSVLCVRIASLLALENCLGNMQNISDYMLNLFKSNRKDLLDIRNGQLNLPITESGDSVISAAFLADNSFKTLG